MMMPLFITMSGQLSPNWLDAFPGAMLHPGPPQRFDNFDSSIIYLDYRGLSVEQKKMWLAASVATGRKVVVLSPLPDDEEAISVIKQGAVGYGHTLAVGSQLREMALVVNHGGLWVGNQILKKVLAAVKVLGGNDIKESVGNNKGSPSNDSSESFMSCLSTREVMVAREVARGATNQEISARLVIKERTVKAHITSIFNKLKVRNRVELALLLNNVQLPKDPMDNGSKRYAL